jgi:hypothetical protein
MSTPNHGIPYVPENTLDPAAGLNDALNVIDAVFIPSVISIGDAAPPGSPADGDLYIVGAGTGAWAGQDDNLARYVAEGTFWQFFSGGTQVNLALNLADGDLYANLGDSNGWNVVSGGGGAANVSDLAMFFPGTPGSAQLMFKFVAARDFEFPANFAGAVGHIGTNPTGSFVMDVSVQGSNIGTITVSTGGAFTFATTGGLPIDVDAGDRIEIEAPVSTDATAADIAATLVADLILPS